MELPDWLRGIVLLGRDGEEYRVVGVDENGYLGVLLKAAAEVTIPGDVSVDQNAKDREMQGADGATLRTVAVDSDGQLIMVPRGASGNYMDVDESGFLIARIVGAELGVGWHPVAVDASGQMIMVPRGQSGHYMAVDEDGYLGAILKAAADVNVQGSVPVDQNAKDREMQGADGATLRTVAVDSDGQLIMVPRGQNGNYLTIDASGYMTTVIKGTYGATLKTLATDDEGYLVSILKDNSDQWGKKISVFGDCWGSTSGAGADVQLSPYFHHVGGYSCLLTSGTTVGKSAQIRTYGEYAPADRVGLEVGFSVSTQPDYIYFDLRVWDGSRVHQLYARLNNATDKLQILNSALAYVDVCTFQRPDVPQLSYRVKFVADLDAERWVRVLSRGVEYDVSAVVTRAADSDATAYFEATVAVQEDGVTSHTIYVDSMIITTNEP